MRAVPVAVDVRLESAAVAVHRTGRDVVVAGIGIVMLAKMSGRPIYPATVVTSRRIDFNSWDRASMGLPFGRGAIVIGKPLHVAADADEAAMESTRRALEIELDRVQHDAFALVGARDPGADLSLAAGRLPA